MQIGKTLQRASMLFNIKYKIFHVYSAQQLLLIKTQLFSSFVIDLIPLPAQVLPYPHVQDQLPPLQARIMDFFPFWTFWQVSEPCLCLSHGTDPDNKIKSRARDQNNNSNQKHITNSTYTVTPLLLQYFISCKQQIANTVTRSAQGSHHCQR